jgi:hypothetical protein
MAQLIKSDDSTTEIKPQQGGVFAPQEFLHILHEALGGDAEGIFLTADQWMYFHEDGIRLNLPANAAATALLRRHRPDLALHQGIIRGNVVIATLSESGDDQEEGDEQ